MQPSSIAIAISEARVTGSVCSQARVRQSTTEQLSPIHSRNSELPARSSQKLSCSAWREIANIIATSSTISTTASTARDSQKSGRNRVEDGPRVSEAGAAIAAASGARLGLSGLGCGEQGVLEAEQR